MIVSFIYSQHLETIHTDLSITVEFHVTATVPEDDDTDVSISDITSMVSRNNSFFADAVPLDVPDEPTASQDEKRMLAIFRERAREAASKLLAEKNK